MFKARRNDPCPCGSGKKYKHCCMLKERAQQSKAVVARREYEELFHQLIAFARAPSLIGEISPAFETFWNGHYGGSALKRLNSYDVFRFLDYFIFDYPLWESKRRPIEEFAQREAPKLSPYKAEMLDRWKDATLSLYRVEGVGPRRELYLVDLILGTPSEVADGAFFSLISAGDLVLGRVLLCGEVRRLSFGPALLSPEMEPGLLDFSNRAWRDYQEAHYKADQLAFLRESSHLFNHYLIQQAQLSRGQGLARSPKYYDVSKALAALEHAREEKEEERQEALQIPEAFRDAENDFEPRPIAGGRLLLPSERHYSEPRPEDSHKTIAGGKLLLP